MSEFDCAYEEQSGGLMGRLSSHVNLTALAILAISCLITYALFSIVSRLENSRVRDNFQLVALRHHSLLERTIHSSISPLATLQAFYRSSDSVYRDEFKSFVEPLLAQHAEIQSLQWIPKVASARESVYEQTARREGVSGFEIRSWPSGDGAESHKQGAQKFPIYVIEPLVENRDLLGIDLASFPKLGEALEWSCDQDAVAATQMISPAGREGDETVMFVLLPVYQTDLPTATVAERRAQLLGYVAATYKVESIVSQTLSKQDREQFDIFVYDMMAPAQKQLLCYTGNHDEATRQGFSLDEEAGRTDDYAHSAVLNLADRLWGVRYLPSASFLQSQNTDRARILLLAGLVASVLLALGAIIALRHSARVRRVSVQLKAAMDRLERDVYERRKAEGALQSSEALYRSTIDAMSEIILVVDPQLKITLVNRQLVERIRGMGLLHGLIGKSLSDAFPMVTPEEEQKYYRVFETGEAQTGTECYQFGGCEYQVDVQRIPVVEDGKVVRVITAGRDLTEHKKTEHALRLTQFAVDKAADAVYWMGPDAKFVYVNEAACRALGYSKDELLTMTVHDIDPNFPVEAWPKHWQDMEQFRSFTIQSEHRTKDGRTFPVEITVNLVEFEGHKFNCAYARDASEANRHSNVEYSGLCSFQGFADSLALGVAVISPRKKLLYTNRQLKEWYPHIDLSSGHRCFEALNGPAPCHECVDCPLDQTLDHRRTHQATIKRLIGTDYVDFKVTTSPIRDKNDNVFAIVEMIEACPPASAQTEGDKATADHRLISG